MAAVTGLGAAIVTGISTEATYEQLDLERKPVLVLTARPEFYLQDQAEHLAPPRKMLFLNPGGSQIADLPPSVPVMTADGHLYGYPPLFAHFTLTNGGRVPIVNVHVTFEIAYYANLQSVDAVSEHQKAVVSVPLLASGATYDFGVANADVPSRYQVQRTAILTRVDTEKPTEVTLFTDDGVSAVESMINQPVAMRLGAPPKK